MEIPIYLFTGFLEAGKTSFIAETMRDPNFNDGVRKYLIIQCEEGEEELDPTELGANVLENPDDVMYDDEEGVVADDDGENESEAYVYEANNEYNEYDE